MLCGSLAPVAVVSFFTDCAETVLSPGDNANVSPKQVRTIRTSSRVNLVIVSSKMHLIEMNVSEVKCSAGLKLSNNIVTCKTKRACSDDVACHYNVGSAT